MFILMINCLLNNTIKLDKLLIAALNKKQWNTFVKKDFLNL